MDLPVLPDEKIAHIHTDIQIASHLIAHLDQRISVRTRNGQTHRKRSVRQWREIVIVALLGQATHPVVVEFHRHIGDVALNVFDKVSAELFILHLMISLNIKYIHCYPQQGLAWLTAIDAIVKLLDFG